MQIHFKIPKQNLFLSLVLILGLSGCKSGDSEQASDDGGKKTASSNNESDPSSMDDDDDSSNDGDDDDDDDNDEDSSDDDDDNDDNDDDSSDDDDDDDDETSGSESGSETDGDTTDSSSEEEESEESSSESGDDPISLYVELCGECHGDKGEGTDEGYELRHPTRKYFTWVTRNGRPSGGEFPKSEMEAYDDGTITDEQLTVIYDFLDDFPQPTTGKGLYEDYCRACHGVDGKGGATGVDAAHEGASGILRHVRQGAHLNDPGDRKEHMPAYSKDVLSDEEVMKISDYLHSL